MKKMIKAEVHQIAERTDKIFLSMNDPCQSLIHYVIYVIKYYVSFYSNGLNGSN